MATSDDNVVDEAAVMGTATPLPLPLAVLLLFRIWGGYRHANSNSQCFLSAEALSHRLYIYHGEEEASATEHLGRFFLLFLFLAKGENRMRCDASCAH